MLDPNVLPRLLRSAEVEEICGFRRQWLYKLIRKNKFPEPVRIGARAVRWRSDEVRDWIDARPVGRGSENEAARRARELKRQASAA